MSRRAWRPRFNSRVVDANRLGDAEKARGARASRRPARNEAVRVKPPRNRSKRRAPEPTRDPPFLSRPDVGLVPVDPLPTARDEPRRVLSRVLARAHQRALPSSPRVRLLTRPVLPPRRVVSRSPLAPSRCVPDPIPTPDSRLRRASSGSRPAHARRSGSRPARTARTTASWTTPSCTARASCPPASRPSAPPVRKRPRGPSEARPR